MFDGIIQKITLDIVFWDTVFILVILVLVYFCGFVHLKKWIAITFCLWLCIVLNMELQRHTKEEFGRFESIFLKDILSSLHQLVISFIWFQ